MYPGWSELSIQRVEERTREWNVVVQETVETPSSFIVFGIRSNQPVVLKVSRQSTDEWESGEVLKAFNGRGVVRVYEYIEGAVLLERLNPGTSLAHLTQCGRDEEATDVLAELIDRMAHPRRSLEKFSTAREWGRGFHRYLASGDVQIPTSLVEQGQQLYMGLCDSERDVGLQHGDLQHYNILFDSDRGWVAIDPKGVVGEIEYEIGAGLRNPYENPELLADAETIERRLRQYEDKIKIDTNRALRWGFAQAVLSAIWTVEDGFPLDARNPGMMLANAIRRML